MVGVNFAPLFTVPVNISKLIKIMLCLFDSIQGLQDSERFVLSTSSRSLREMLQMIEAFLHSCIHSGVNNSSSSHSCGLHVCRLGQHLHHHIHPQQY
jgi:hypothetical protein